MAGALGDWDRDPVAASEHRDGRVQPPQVPAQLRLRDDHADLHDGIRQNGDSAWLRALAYARRAQGGSAYLSCADPDAFLAAQLHARPTQRVRRPNSGQFQTGAELVV